MITVRIKISCQVADEYLSTIPTKKEWTSTMYFNEYPI